jgi:hypothetical protein
MDQPSTTFEKPSVQLTGTDGNVFALLGRCSKALKANGLRVEAEEMSGRVFGADSYHNALAVMMQYVDAS